MTGRDDKLPSVLVLAQDGRTAPLRTLGVTALIAHPSSLEPASDTEQEDTTRMVKSLSEPSGLEEYSGCSASILLGDADCKLLVSSLIRLPLLNTNKTLIFRGNAAAPRFLT